jgi:predicted short-subunit dehydrogenase-like oxidoreductase (DUF2520 family)
MDTLCIVGAGQVGKTLGRIWRESAIFQVIGVLNSNLASGQNAVYYIGAGRAVGSIDDLPRSDFYLIAVPDDAIGECYSRLARSHDLTGSVVFHCSGSLSSSVLRENRGDNGWVASVHPVKSFADVDAAVASFAGTYCGYEGDAAALAALLPKFEVIGALPFAVDPANKTLYHTAVVFSMNYLVALVDVGLQCFAESGVPDQLALKALRPILTETLENVFRLGPAGALTGPIARGDAAVVARQLDDLANRSTDLEHLYALLGRYALRLAEESGKVPLGRLRDISEVLAEHLRSGPDAGWQPRS